MLTKVLYKFHIQLQLGNLVSVVSSVSCSLWESTQVLLLRFHTPSYICIKLEFSLPVFAQLVAALHLYTSDASSSLCSRFPSEITDIPLLLVSLWLHLCTHPNVCPKSYQVYSKALFLKEEPLIDNIIWFILGMPNWVELNACVFQ